MELHLDKQFIAGGTILIAYEAYVHFDIQDGTADQIENCSNSVKGLDMTIWLRVSAASG